MLPWITRKRPCGTVGRHAPRRTCDSAHSTSRAPGPLHGPRLVVGCLGVERAQSASSNQRGARVEMSHNDRLKLTVHGRPGAEARLIACAAPEPERWVDSDRACL